MRIVRYQKGLAQPQLGWLYEDRVGQIEGDVYGEYQRGEALTPIDDVRLLTPVLPGKIICIGRNYAEHAKEHQVDVPDLPLLFLKPPSAVIGPGDTILLPPQSQRVEHEGELVVVIGKRGRWIAPEDASRFVLGYTLGIDVTARDLQRRDGQWTRGKGFDTFCPLGPFIETDFDPSDAMLTTHVNNELRQMASTRDMLFTVRQLVAFISSVMTVEPGDIVMTGTPAGVGPLVAGDQVKVTIEGLGELTNRVAVDKHRPTEI
ncbi:MAG: fumarylacetoacetate hydrolase family protein [Anaerolineaceae bacterium]|nr:fumarylacetoacetate hydrolase family protein [Anaerolineaceae bacterium]